jgi:hypothetical protein
LLLLWLWGLGYQEAYNTEIVGEGDEAKFGRFRETTSYLW